ncbi:MAG: ABC transporter permease [Clostridiales bacterium]|nr:ABC transporter permease [Clostridiales bacterium]
MSRVSNIVSKYAKRTVFANKGRSILTLIGIVVATMMFSIVASAHVSAIDILKSFASDEYGRWHVQAYSMTSMDYQKIIKDDRIKSVAYVQEIGYDPGSSYNPESQNAVRYIERYRYFVGAMSDEFPELCNLSLLRGRLPRTDSEAIISLEMYSNDRENLAIGKKIKVNLYSRYSEGRKVMNLQYLVRSGTGEVDEQLYPFGSKEYTIVGYFVVPGYARWKNFAENTILTHSPGLSGGSAVNAYFEFKDPAVYTEFTLDRFENEDDCLYNKDFIRLENSADDSKLEMTIGVIAIATIAMIALLAVMLIYNSFSTSSSERIRAIGLLKSVGATRRQVRELILREALYFSIIGIPIGLLLGQVTSYFLFGALNQMSSYAANYFILKNIDLQYRLDYQNIIAPAVLALITVFAAIMLPMIHVSKVYPIEAVHVNDNFSQGKDRKKYRSITMRLFGFTGALSIKNYFRYRKRYRATVISIMASVFMILFANMMVRSVTRRYQIEDIGREDVIRYTKVIGKDGFSEQDRALFSRLSETDTVYSSTMALITECNIQEREGLFSDTVDMYLSGNADEKPRSLEADFVFIDDGTWRELCQKDGIDPEPFLEYGSSKCLIFDSLKVYDETGRMVDETKYFRELPEQILIDTTPSNQIEFWVAIEPVAEVSWQEALGSYASGLQIYLPMSQLNYYGSSHSEGYSIFQFAAKRPVAAIAQMKEILESELYLTDSLEDTGITSRAANAVNSLVEIIMYGYVAMLSFMCFLNLILTVIGNIVFRRKEYILLMSVGMSRKTLFRMVISESLIYFFESVITLLLIMFVSFGVFGIVFERNIMRYINVPYFAVILLLHLFVVVTTTAIGLSRIMTDEIIEGIRKDYY